MARIKQQTKKGSQKGIQILVNRKRDVLNQQIRISLGIPKSEEIDSRAPLQIDNYVEYKDQEFLNVLEIKPVKNKLLSSGQAVVPDGLH